MNMENILQTGFDRALLGLKIVESGAGKASARLVVSEAVQNYFGVLHGGAIARAIA